jgi:hypothetical protein
MATVLSGTSGALYYKPAGTKATFSEAAVDTTDDEITVAPFLNFKPGDPVTFSIVNTETGGTGTGTLPSGLTASAFVLTYVAATGVMTVSATAGGSKLDITDDGTAVTPNAFQVAYADYAAVGDVREWSFEITREEIDVTAIGQTAGQFAPFRRYITGFADGEGSCMVYITDDDANLANRMVQDVIQSQQTGAAFKLYIDRVTSAGTVSGTLSRSIEFDAVLTSASLTVNPDDAQMVEIAFRPAATPVFDFSKAA